METLCLRTHHLDSSRLTAVHVQLPAQVLPVANASTVRGRWQQWSMLTAGGFGSSVDPDRCFQPEAESVPWRTLLCNKDNLTLNSCIICLEERELDAERAMHLGSEGAMKNRDVLLGS